MTSEFFEAKEDFDLINALATKYPDTTVLGWLFFVLRLKLIMMIIFSFSFKMKKSQPGYSWPGQPVLWACAYWSRLPVNIVNLRALDHESKPGVRPTIVMVQLQLVKLKLNHYACRLRATLHLILISNNIMKTVIKSNLTATIFITTTRSSSAARQSL